MKKHLSYICLAFLLSGCAASPTHELTLSGLNPAHFEKMIDDNKPVKLYTLKNSNGMEVCITNFGARIVSIMVPDKNGEMTDVVLGFDNIEDYIQVPSDFGATIGRYANRIGQGKSKLTEKKFNYHKTITGTVFMEDQPVGNIKCSKRTKPMTRPLF